MRWGLSPRVWSLRLGASQSPREQEKEDTGGCHRGPSRSPPQEPTELLPPVRPGWSEQLRGERGGDRQPSPALPRHRPRVGEKGQSPPLPRPEPLKGPWLKGPFLPVLLLSGESRLSGTYPNFFSMKKVIDIKALWGLCNTSRWKTLSPTNPYS